MAAADSKVTHDYIHVLERAVLDLRMRIRYGDGVSIEEVHDLLDAVHNIPRMLREYGGWYVPENIDNDLLRYDQKWMSNGESTLRHSLMVHLQRARDGEYDHL